MPRRPPVASTSARWVAVALIVVLAAATAVLAFMAIERTRGGQVDAAPAPAPLFTFGSGEATPTPTPTPTGAAGFPHSAERFLSVGSGAMWRATAGECGEIAPLVERSGDGGQTWEDVTPLYRGIGEVESLDAFAVTEAEMIARMGASCETQALRTFTQGEFWEPYPDVLAASRYLDADVATLQTPDGPVEVPCADPRSFRAVGATVALICDGQPHVLRADTWTPLGPASAVALSATGNALLVAGSADGCAGIAATRYTGPDLATAEPLGCAAGIDPSQPVAIAATGNTAILWSADTLIPLGR